METIDRKGPIEKRRFGEYYRFRTYDVDPNRRTKVSGLLQSMQEVANHQMEAQPPSCEDLLAQGKALMLSRLDMKIFQQTFMGDEVCIRSWLCPSQRATLLRGYDVHHGGRMVAKACSQWSVVDIEKRKIGKVSELNLCQDSIGIYEEIWEAKLKISREDQDSMGFLGMKKVDYSDLDYNGHMNHTYYLDVFCNFIPEIITGTHCIEGLRLHYHQEALLDETLNIYGRCYQQNGSLVYQFLSQHQRGELNMEAEIYLVAVEV